MHNKSIVAAISLFCSIGGWWLWNIVLSATYTNNVIYNVRGGFLDRFGRNILWWLTLLFIVLTCNVFEFAVASIRGAFWPTDVRDSPQFLILMCITLTYPGRHLSRVRAGPRHPQTVRRGGCHGVAAGLGQRHEEVQPRARAGGAGTSSQGERGPGHPAESTRLMRGWSGQRCSSRVAGPTDIPESLSRQFGTVSSRRTWSLRFALRGSKISCIYDRMD